ncbi:hypothetical protein ABZ958_21940 [Streptomyces sp. NPDC046237]|uniref:hypothetical protein n=1 Tax=Streptomyces sp. NPDC046237 TaxID=3154914 RepID=UPI0033F77C75
MITQPPTREQALPRPNRCSGPYVLERRTRLLGPDRPDVLTAANAHVLIDVGRHS